MRPTHSFILVAFIIGNAMSAGLVPVQGQSVPTPESLRKELPGHLRATEQRFSRISGSATILDKLNYDRVPEKTKAKWKLAPGTTLPQGEQTTGKFHVSFSLSDQYSKCDVTSDMEGVITTVAGNDRAKPPYRNVFCIGPRGSFTLLWKTSESNPEVSTFSQTGERQKPRIQTLAKFAIDATHSLPLNKPLAELLGDDQFSIEKIEKTVVDNHDCFRVSFVYRQKYNRREDKEKKSTDIVLRGNFVTDPAREWMLRSWDFSSPDVSRSNSMKIDYLKDAKGSFLPSEIVSTMDGSKIQACVFERISTDPIDDKKFTLSEYSLPELDQPIGEVSDNSLAIWLGSASLLTLAISAILWFRSRRGLDSEHKG